MESCKRELPRLTRKRERWVNWLWSSVSHFAIIPHSLPIQSRCHACLQTFISHRSRHCFLSNRMTAVYFFKSSTSPLLRHNTNRLIIVTTFIVIINIIIIISSRSSSSSSSSSYCCYYWLVFEVSPQQSTERDGIARWWILFLKVELVL